MRRQTRRYDNISSQGGQAATESVFIFVHLWFNIPMIPVHLKLSGFLSYHDPVEIDFSTFDLACISGHNGAGKSSLLDAITWSLFGQARKRDESLINTHKDVKAAEVILDFEYEGNTYRVQRSLARGKGSMLEFQIQDGAGWRPLTERTLRETQARIEHILRLDYETFVNAAFFLQGKADQFAQQTASKRKDILGSILGLEAWEIYKERTAERRKVIESELTRTTGQISEIEAELAQEEPRKARLAELETELQSLSSVRRTQEAALENVRRVAASLNEQRKLIQTLAAQLERNRRSVSDLDARLAGREAERAAFADTIARASEIEAAYQAWQKARTDLEVWNALAEKFRAHDARRQPLLTRIETEKARLDQERETLTREGKVISDQSSVISDLEGKINQEKQTLVEIEARLAERAGVDEQLQSARQMEADLKAENTRLKTEMDELKARIEKLESTDGAICPLCGQPLSPEDRQALIERLQSEGKVMGDAWRANKSQLEGLTQQVTNLAASLASFAPLEEQRLAQTATATQLTERIEASRRAQKEWEKTGQPRLAEIVNALEQESYAVETRARLAEVDADLKSLGYDAAAHDVVRKAEVEGRFAEDAYRLLEKARAALKPIDDEIANLQENTSKQKALVNEQEKEHGDASAALAAAESQAPDLEAAERALYDLQEQENRLNQEVGAARQKVTVLDDLRTRKSGLEVQVEEFRQQVGRHRQLERAFGKDGVPALLIEQALPEIEAHANELLDRLSNGVMSVRFVTQAEYKDKKRDDMKETLDILISDGSGTRDYETFSGGEAFRINFAIRLALSRVLAQRKGARLQTLVIDEGFGSQDAQGRQRLIEAINAVKKDFAKILVITHLDELKDAFPTRVEVEKGERGSEVRVI